MAGDRELTDPAPAVLGRILLLQSGLHAQADDEGMARFLVAGLARIPGIGGAAVCKEGHVIGALGEWPVPPASCGESFQGNSVDRRCPTPCPCAGNECVRLALRSSR